MNIIVSIEQILNPELIKIYENMAKYVKNAVKKILSSINLLSFYVNSVVITLPYYYSKHILIVEKNYKH